MASSPPPSPSASVPPPPSSQAPPPASSPPPQTRPNANSNPPPPASNSPPPSSSSSSPPPSVPAAPPPAPPPPAVSPPPPVVLSPPPASPSLPPPVALTPPPAGSPPPPVLTPPPTSAVPPPASQPPPLLPSSPPPRAPPVATPPTPGSPPSTVPPPSPSTAQPPPPQPNAPPTNPSPPPPSAKPPAGSPAPPAPAAPPPSGSPSRPAPSAPPPKDQPPSVPSAPSPPSNSSGGTTPSTPSVLSPPASPGSPLPLPAPATPSSGPPSPPNPNKSSDPSPSTGRGSGNSSGGGGLNAGAAAGIAVVAGLVILSLLGIAVWLVRKRRGPVNGYNAGFVMPSPSASSQLSESSPNERSPSVPLVYNSFGSQGQGHVNSLPDPALGSSKSWFTYEELYDITNGFSTQNLLGEGGFGCVYKGVLQDGREVAVKQLKDGGGQGEREFQAEVEIISRIHHRHLVSLVGYCIAEQQRLLVYDYVPNNTLHYHLHGRRRPIMDWATRVKVAAGSARGIAYLHEDCHPRVIHRDIKSSNILLDNNFEAKVSDFGLARLAMDAATHVTTRVMGTFGYLAPEYASSGKLTEKSDVFSFGVVLLELITGRKPVDASQPLGDESLVEWARPLMARALESGNFEELVDPRLENEYDEPEMFRMIEAAAACVRHSAAKRPRMGLVVRALDGLADGDINNGVKPGQSELFQGHTADIRLFQRMAFGSQDYSTDFSEASWKSRTQY